jgi:cytochrome c peroxidase
MTADERAELIAFLRSFTDKTFLTDPRYSDPWKKEP